MSKQPHIVIINPDQWRGDVMGHLGHPAAVSPPPRAGSSLTRLTRRDPMSLEHGHVDYESFGAVGDGVTDDLPAICEVHAWAKGRTRDRTRS